MSIIPVGRRREQINQGALQNQSILDSDLFKKFGVGTLVPPQERQQKPEPAGSPNAGSPNAGEALMQGGLNAPGQADRHEQTVDPANQAPPSSQGITPAVPEDPNKSPFLTTVENPDDQQQQYSGTYEMMQWVKQIVQGNGFIVDIDKTNSGTSGTQITISPQRPEDGFDFEKWEHVVQRMGQIGVDPGKVKYKNNSATFVLESGGGGGKMVSKAKNRR